MARSVADMVAGKASSIGVSGLSADRFSGVR
jgi:hypothetical protein